MMDRIPSRLFTYGFILLITLVGVSITVTGSTAAQSTGLIDANTSDIAGSGTSGDPYIITNISELQAIEDDLDAHYKLGSNIDASVTAKSNNGSGFNPIGTVNQSFTGSFNGDGYTITGITISRQEKDNVGLFAVMNGSVSNVQINAADITGQGDFPDGVGIVAGRIGTTGEVTNVETSGEVSGSEYVGGIAGLTAGNISSSASSTTTSITDGRGRLGGLVGGLGNSAGSSVHIEDSHASGNINGGSGQKIGGLVGNQFENASIRNSHATGSVSGDRWSGGLVGEADGTITDSYASGQVSWSGKLENTTSIDINNVIIGGLVGGLDTSGKISDSYARGDVLSEGQLDGRGVTIGGVVGANFGDVERVAASGGTLRVLDNPAWNYPDAGRYSGSRIGGITNNNGNLSTSYANVTIVTRGTDGLSVGGITSNNFGSINNSYAIGSITVGENPDNLSNSIGGLTNQNSRGYSFSAKGEIRNSYAAIEYNTWKKTFDNFAGVIHQNQDGESEAIVDTVYWDQQRSDVSTGIRQSGGSVNDVQGLSTSQMTGKSAADAMDKLDFQAVWNTTSGYPRLVDSPEVIQSSGNSSVPSDLDGQITAEQYTAVLDGDEKLTAGGISVAVNQWATTGAVNGVDIGARELSAIANYWAA